MDSDYLYIGISLLIPVIAIITIITFLIIYSNKYKKEVDDKLKTKYLNIVIGLSVCLFLVLIVFVYLIIKVSNVLNRVGDYEMVEKPKYSPYSPYSPYRPYSSYKKNLEIEKVIPNTLTRSSFSSYLSSSSPSPSLLNLRRIESSSIKNSESEDVIKKTPTFPLSIY